METASKEIWRSVRSLALLAILFLLFFSQGNSVAELLTALPFLLLIYGIFLLVGGEEISAKFSQWIGRDVLKLLAFPFLYILLYVTYILIQGGDPTKGVLGMIPYMIVLPGLMFYLRREGGTQINWIDFTFFVLFLIPTLYIDGKPSGQIPVHGHDLDSIFHIAIILSAVYTYVVIRRLPGVGFYPSFSWRSLAIALGVWISFYVFVWVVGSFVNFMRYTGHEVIDQPLLIQMGIALIGSFFHTALFEELFFRGILLNLFAKRIEQAKTWKTFWLWGVILSIPSALLVGYTLKGNYQWFPALMVILLYGAAFLFEKRATSPQGVFTGLAITGTIFGLVHYHSHAIVYIGFACIAGWAYGYTYLKTRSVFYSAVVHALVNSSALIIGLEFIR